MIRIEVQHLDENNDVRHIEFETFNDWDMVIGYIWKNFFIERAFASSESDIRMNGVQILGMKKCMLIIEDGV